MAPNVVGLPTAFLAAYGVLLAVISQGENRQRTVDRCGLFRYCCLFHGVLYHRLLHIPAYIMPRMGSANPVFTPYQCFQSADRYVFVGVSNEKFWQAFCQALGLDDYWPMTGYSSMEERLANRDELVRKIAADPKEIARRRDNEEAGSRGCALRPCARDTGVD